jgi:hypothetical protein
VEATSSTVALNCATSFDTSSIEPTASPVASLIARARCVTSSALSSSRVSGRWTSSETLSASSRRRWVSASICSLYASMYVSIATC